MKQSATAILAVAFFSAMGCGIKSPKEDLRIRTPSSWSAAFSGNHEKISTSWIADFHDAKLSGSVEEALRNNRSLRAAVAKMREAREESVVARARGLPSLNFIANNNDRDRGASLSGFNLAASWEPDLWGRLRDLSRAAGADEKAAIEDFRGARLSLAANTAKAYVNLVTVEQEIDLAELTLDSFQKNLRIVERNYKATGEGALDIQFARTNVSSAQRVMEQRKLEQSKAARILEVLLGRYPQGEIKSASQLPLLTSTVPAGLPAQLIERRPDLAGAKARLFASAKRAEAARKSLLPDLSLTAASGANSGNFADLLDSDFLVSQITTRLDQAIFAGGALAANARIALAKNERLVNEYAQLALEAFREVEISLAADRSLGAQQEFLSNEVSQASLAERQAERDYAEGINFNILSVLEAQRRANNARAAIIRLRNQRLENRIDLHLALGGDFQTSEN